MKVFKFALCGALSLSGVVGRSHSARAIPLPDSSSCSGNGIACLNVTHSGNSGVGIVGVSDNGYGVQGSTAGSSTSGVRGDANGSQASAVFGWYSGTGTGFGVQGRAWGGYGSAILGDANYSWNVWAGDFIGDILVRRDIWLAGSIVNASDARLKEDVKDSTRGLKDIMALRPVSYRWKDSEKLGAGRQVGLIAQEVQKVIPELVASREGNTTMAVNYLGLVPVLVKALQEQQQMIESQGRRDRRNAGREQGRRVDAWQPRDGVDPGDAPGRLGHAPQGPRAIEELTVCPIEPSAREFFRSLGSMVRDPGRGHRLNGEGCRLAVTGVDAEATARSNRRSCSSASSCRRRTSRRCPRSRCPRRRSRFR